MPIYEFFCEECNTLFNFFSRSVNTTKRPRCPKCNQPLNRQLSAFAFTGRADEKTDIDRSSLNDPKMERAMQMLAGEAGRMNEDDPRQAADLLRKLSDMTGLELGNGMQEALQRMKNGEDPGQIEAEMGDLLEAEDPFLMPGEKGGGPKNHRPAPIQDETLYDL